MFRPPRTIASACLAASALLLWAAHAFAQARVVVKVRDKSGGQAEARVELRSGEGAKVAACQTSGGACELGGVAGGRYSVHLFPESGPSPKPTKAMIPPAGKVTLIVNTGS